MCVIVNDLCGDAKHGAATYLRQRVPERMEMEKVNGLTNRNMVAISVSNIEITSIYNQMTETTKSLRIFTMLVSTRERTSWVVADEFKIHSPSWQSWVAQII